MPPHHSDENERDCPWAATISDRARSLGLLVILLTGVAALAAWGATALWARRAFVTGLVMLDGRPLPHAKVRFLSRGAAGGGRTVSDRAGRAWVSDELPVCQEYHTTTDGAGRYGLSFLPPGGYTVFITGPADEHPHLSFTSGTGPPLVEVRPGFQTHDLALKRRDR